MVTSNGLGTKVAQCFQRSQNEQHVSHSTQLQIGITQCNDESCQKMTLLLVDFVKGFLVFNQKSFLFVSWVA